MKTLIVYASIHHNNTAKIAESMAKELNADTLKAQDATPAIVAGYDIIGIGSGIYMAKFHDKILKVIEENSWEGKKVFLFSTSGIGSGKFHAPVEADLIRKKAEVIGSFWCKGFDTYVKFFNLFGGLAKGHPDEKDLQAAREFAKGIRETEGV